jgi:hypothetical protein
MKAWSAAVTQSALDHFEGQPQHPRPKRRDGYAKSQTRRVVTNLGISAHAAGYESSLARRGFSFVERLDDFAEGSLGAVLNRYAATIAEVH